MVVKYNYNESKKLFEEKKDEIENSSL